MKYRLACMGMCIVFSFMACMPVFAEDINSTEDAREYIGEIMEYITQNYMGGEVSVDQLTKAAISGMTGVLDEYSQYYTPEQYDDISKATAKIVYRPDFQLKQSKDNYWEICDMAIDATARRSGIRNGDKILTVNGTDVKGFSYDEINGVITGSRPGTVNIVVKRYSRQIECPVELTAVQVKTVETGKLWELIDIPEENIDKSVGYVKITTFGEGTASEFQSVINELKKNKVKRLILDLRGNTGGYADQAIELCKTIVPNGVIISTRDKAGNRVSYHSELKEVPFEKIIVLVDNMTASASEIVASAVQDSGIGIVVGEATFGKGVMQSVVEFEGIGLVKLTAYEYYTRNGKRINGVGITPDVPVGKILFLDSSDELESPKVTQALDFLGYNTENTAEITKSIGRLQVNEGLQPTYRLDDATISAINVKIYSKMLQSDRTLLVGYLNSGM